MKKLMYILTGIFFFTLSVGAQSRYVFIDFKDAPRPAIQNEFSYPDKTVTNAINGRFTKMGYKSKDTKGYSVYRGVKMDELGNQPYDLYFKVENKSRKDKDNAVVTMLISTAKQLKKLPVVGKWF